MSGVESLFTRTSLLDVPPGRCSEAQAVPLVAPLLLHLARPQELAASCWPAPFTMVERGGSEGFGVGGRSKHAPHRPGPAHAHVRAQSDELLTASSRLINFSIKASAPSISSRTLAVMSGVEGRGGRV